MEVACGAAIAGKKAACMMKQVGLNVAFPALLRGMHKTIKGALVVVSCDDPGPQSSQTEQDTRLLATLFHIPVFEPASPEEAADIAYYALKYSFEHKTPVILRSTHRVSHARQAVPLYPPGTRKVVPQEGISHQSPVTALGIAASGMTYSIAMDVLQDIGISEIVPVYKIVQFSPVTSHQSPVTSHGSSTPGLEAFLDSVDRVLVLEETDAVIEALIGRGEKVLGRGNGYVPKEGELTYDVVKRVIERATEKAGIKKKGFVPDSRIEEAMKAVSVKPRPPKLCAGCPHRSSFYAMRYAFPDAIFPGDIGCYTLGTLQGAVDTCIDMGSGVTLASGFYNAFHQDGKAPPVLASVGDSTFFHACLPPLYDAVTTNKKFILVIMDNGTTAMTGMQPTPQTGITADGTRTRSITIEDVLKGLGISFVKVVDPYDIPLMIEIIKEAHAYLTSNTQSPVTSHQSPNPTSRPPAVIIARRECLLHARGRVKKTIEDLPIERDCIGCKRCIKFFGCPAITFDEERRKVVVDDGLCVMCGMCLMVCNMMRQKKGSSKF
jgi:indolepyruvate ferredoxin oxidoreductase alpha subunit